MNDNLSKIGQIKPKNSQEIRGSRLGLGLETLDRNLFDPERAYDHLANCGVKWARIQSGWNKTEKEKGVYDFAWLDRIVDNLLRRGVTPWLNLSYGNKLYIPECDHPFGVGFAPLHSETARQGWLAYVENLVKHFRDRLGYYEIWNEPDHPSFWRPQVSDGFALGELTVITARKIKELQPAAKTIGGVMAQGLNVNGLSFLKRALDAGMGDHLDYVSFHRYSAWPEDEDRSGTAIARALLDSYRPGIGLIQGETGCPSRNTGFGAMCRMDWTEERQAKYLLRMILADLGREVFFTSYFTTVDIPAYAGRDYQKDGATEPWAFFGVLRGPDFSPKPSYHALQNLCSIFTDEVAPASFPLRTASLAPKPARLTRACGGACWGQAQDLGDCRLLKQYVYARNGAPALVYWNPTDLLKEECNGTISVWAGQDYGPARLVDPFDGAIYEVAPAVFQDSAPGVKIYPHLPIKDYPLILAFGEFLGEGR